MISTLQSPFAAIMAVDPATVGRRGFIRHERRKLIASLIRDLLKAYRIKGVSITAPKYSMVRSVEIRLPEARREHYSDRGGIHDRLDCPTCLERNEASNRLEAIILAAYPDLRDRSDSLTDHFDYRISID